MLRKIACGILRRAASPCIDTDSPEAWFHPALTIANTQLSPCSFISLFPGLWFMHVWRKFRFTAILSKAESSLETNRKADHGLEPGDVFRL